MINGKSKHFFVQRLILLAFIGEPPIGYQACHIDGVRTNNKLDNLRWDTPSNNSIDKIKHGTSHIGQNHPMAKITDNIVIEMRQLRKSGKLIKEIANIFNVSEGLTTRACNGKSWKHIGNETKQNIKRITIEERTKIIEMRNSGKSYNEIAQIFNKQYATVYAAIKRGV